MVVQPRQQLVVIGSGWVGLYIAQYIDTKLYDVTIISPRRTSAYTPLLASAACGLFPFSCAEESLRSKSNQCQFMKANARGIDFVSKQVHCEAAFDHDEPIPERHFDVSYDRLIIAPGCDTNTFGTPGVAEYAMFMKHVSDAMALRKRLFDRLEEAALPCTSRQRAKALLHVAIVGGGPTGVEITAELSDLVKHELADLYPKVASLLRISIYDVASHILAQYDKELYEYATEQMLKQGVNIATDCVIEKVDRENIYIKDQGPVPYGILLWAPGNTSVPLVNELDVKKSEKGLSRIQTDSMLRVKKSTFSVDSDVYPDVFALGDAADIEGRPLPTTAEVAVQKSKYLVGNLNSRSRSQDPSWPSFEYTDKKLVTYIGQKDGIGQGWTKESGQRAWLSWRSGSFTWTRTYRNWFGIALSTVMNALFGKDIMRL